MAVDSLLNQTHMKNLNRVTLIGQLTADPESKRVPTGHDLTTFGVATNYSWKDDEGEWQNGVDYHRVVSWQKLARDAAKQYKKGDKIFLEGKLRTKSWVTDDGTKAFRTEIVAHNLLPMTSKAAKAKVKELEQEEEALVSEETVPV